MKRLILLLIIIINSIGLIAQDFQKQILLDNYYGREAEFGDFDRDGDLDILMFYTFDDPYGEAYTHIFENTDTGFIETESEFPRVEYFGSLANGAVNWVDYNNDGFLDVFLVSAQGYSIEYKLFLNNRDKSFTEKTINVGDIELGSCGPSWFDYDNDGDSDLTIFGDEDFNNYTIKIYENELNSQEFTVLDFDFGNCIIKSRKPWADFNNDGYPDLLVNSPTDNYQCNIAIFKSNGDKSFTKVVFPDLIGLNQDVLNQTGDMSWGDYNNDGYPDILISGQNANSTGTGTTTIFINNGNETFSEVSPDGVYPAIGNVSIEWGDFDNDGNLDILQTGAGDISDIQMFSETMLYLNEGDTFRYSDIDFLDAHQDGMSTGADYTGDNNLDILVLGEISYTHHQIALFDNITAESNTQPLPPVSLEAESVNNELILSWDAGTDLETSQDALSYNVYLIHKNDTVVQPNSLQNGKRTLVGIGNAHYNRFYKYNISESGLVRWGVQSVDNSYIGSMFSVEDSVSVTYIPNEPPTISIISPANEQNVTSPEITVSGTANDTDGTIAMVQVKLNNGTWQNATGTTSWTKSVALETGSNIIYVKAQDNDDDWSSEDSVIIDFTTNIKNPDLSDEIKIYPNPTNGILTIENSKETDYIEIYSMTGDLVYNNIFKKKIDISNFNKSIYLLKIYSKNGEIIKTEKIIVN